MRLSVTLYAHCLSCLIVLWLNTPPEDGTRVLKRVGVATLCLYFTQIKFYIIIFYMYPPNTHLTN
jgi:hypothetical protein